MADLTLIYPGVKITDVSTPTSVITPYGLCYMLVSTSMGDVQTLVEVFSIEMFLSLYGDDSPSEKYVKAFFNNLINPSVRLMIYRVNPDDPDDGSPVPPVLDDWLEAFETIDPTANPGGVILCPEAFEMLSNNQDRVKIVEKMDAFCSLDQDSYWQGIADLSSSLTTIAEAVTDVNVYSSDRGNISVYTPAYYNSDDEKLLPSAAMAAISLSVWSTGAYYEAPAGHRFPIQDCKRLSYEVKKNEYGLAHQSNINLIRYFNNVGFLPYDCITLSTAQEYLQIPSVICFKITAYLLTVSLLSLVFSPLKGTGDLIAVAEATINRVLFSCWENGFLVGRAIEDAYTVEQVNVNLPSPANATLSYRVAVRPAYSIIKYRIYLSNLLSVRSFV